MKVEVLQDSFTAGQFSKSLFGRVDIAQYENACETVQNFLVKPEGSLISCPGTEFINDAKNSEPGQINALISSGTQLALLVHADSDFSDSSDYNHTVTTSGTPSIDNSLFAFGGGSVQLAITDSSVVIYDTHEIFNFADNDFTVEARVSLENLTDHTNQYLNIISKGRPDQGANNFNGWSLQFFENFGQGYWFEFSFTDQTGTDKTILTPFLLLKSGDNPEIQDYDGFENFTLTANQFYYIRAIRSGDFFRLYIDGVEAPVKYSTDSNDEYNTTYVDISSSTFNYDANVPVVLGGSVDSSKSGYEDFWDGNIDEAMVLNGIGLTQPFPGVAWSSGTDFRARLISFIFSRTDSYIIEMGVGYFRFYTDGAVVEA